MQLKILELRETQHMVNLGQKTTFFDVDTEQKIIPLQFGKASRYQKSIKTKG